MGQKFLAKNKFGINETLLITFAYKLLSSENNA